MATLQVCFQGGVWCSPRMLSVVKFLVNAYADDTVLIFKMLNILRNVQLYSDLAINFREVGASSSWLVP